MSEVLAGKIGVTNGGEWNAETYYEEATFVRHQNNLYLSNLPSTGVEPTNEEYWMLAMKGFSGEDVQTLIDSINNIINGTTQVGNAKTLDGHGAEYFAPLSRVLPQTMPSGTDLNNCTESGVYFFNGSATNYVNVPSTTAHNGILRVDKWEDDGAIRIMQIYTTCNSTVMYFRTTYTVDGWSAWKELFTTAGGTITSPSDVILSLNSTHVNKRALVKYLNGDTNYGYLGFTEANKPTYASNTGALNELLHTGNKPTGSYTGNGSATTRTIATNGIGNVVFIKAQYGFAIVTTGGYIAMRDGSVSCGTDAYVSSGSLKISSTSPVLNADGVTYNYEVL